MEFQQLYRFFPLIESNSSMYTLVVYMPSAVLTVRPFVQERSEGVNVPRAQGRVQPTAAERAGAAFAGGRREASVRGSARRQLPHRDGRELSQIV